MMHKNLSIVIFLVILIPSLTLGQNKHDNVNDVMNFKPLNEIIRIVKSHQIDTNTSQVNMLLGLNLKMDKKLLSILKEDLVSFGIGNKQIDYRTKFHHEILADSINDSSGDQLHESRASIKSTLGNLNRTLVFTNLEMYYNHQTQTYYSRGKPGVAFAGDSGIHKHCKGFIELGYRSKGDFFNIYLESKDGEWYFLEYKEHTLKLLSSNQAFNSKLLSVPAQARKIPLNNEHAFIYYLADEDAKKAFLNRMKERKKISVEQSSNKDSDYEKPTSPPKLTLKANSLKFTDKDGNSRLDGDEKAKVTFTLMNEGQGKAQGFQTKIDEINNVKGLTYEVGKTPDNLKPAEEGNFHIRVSGNKKLETGNAKFRIQVEEHFGFDPPPINITFPTQKFEPPNLTITDQVFTSPTTGKMQKGVSINLKMALQNKGHNTASNVKVTLNTPKNVIAAGKNTYELGALAPGQSEKISYGFFTNNRYTKQQVPIEVKVTESYGQYGETQTFTATLQESLQEAASLKVEPENNKQKDYEDVSLLPEVDRNIPTTQTDRPNAVAVVIGNKDYRKTDPVKYAHRDARTVKKYMVNTLGFREGNILYVENASLGDFRTLFGTEESHKGKLYNTMKHGESEVFVYYSGHGAPGLEDQKGYFVPVGCDPNYVESSGYPLETFYNNLGKLPSEDVTVLTDACFSGANVFEEVSPIVVKVKPQSQLLQNGAVINSSQGEQVSSWHTEKKHGLFTWAVLKAMQNYEETDTNGDRKVTVRELYNRIADNNEGVPYYARKLHGINQTPVLKGQKKDEVVFNY